MQKDDESLLESLEDLVGQFQMNKIDEATVIDTLKNIVDNKEIKHPECDLDARVTEAVSDADWNFWDKIIDHFPEIKTGDVDPWEAMMFRQACEKSVLEWYNMNRPRKEKDDGTVD